MPVSNEVSATPTGGTGADFSLLDATGDLIVASADDTAARLGRGTNGQVLVADGSQMLGLKWVNPSELGLPTPEDLPVTDDLIVWLDATDRSTVAVDSFGGVIDWLDKSGHENNATFFTESERPIFTLAYLSGVGSCPVVMFDADKRLQIENLDLIRNLSGATLFVVLRDTATSGESTYLYITSSSTASGWWVVRSSGGVLEAAGRRLFADSFQSEMGSAVSGEWAILTSRMDWASAETLLRINGVDDIDTTFQSAGTTEDQPSAGIGVGGTPYTNPLGLQGPVAEVLLYSRALTPAEYEDVEAYLAAKYGIAI